MDLNEINDFITGIFPSVTMSDMAEYWKDFFSMCDALFYLFMLTIVLMHFKDLIDSQRAMLPWLTIYDNILAGYLTFGQCLQISRGTEKGF